MRTRRALYVQTLTIEVWKFKNNIKVYVNKVQYLLVLFTLVSAGIIWLCYLLRLLALFLNTNSQYFQPARRIVDPYWLRFPNENNFKFTRQN